MIDTDKFPTARAIVDSLSAVLINLKAIAMMPEALFGETLHDMMHTLEEPATKEAWDFDTSKLLADLVDRAQRATGKDLTSMLPGLGELLGGQEFGCLTPTPAPKRFYPWNDFVHDQFEKSKTTEHPGMFVGQVILKGPGDIGFGPIKLDEKTGLLVLCVVGKGQDNKPAKMERHFAIDDIVSIGLMQVLAEPERKSNLVV